MKLGDVYLKYQTPQNLQEHMMRVAAFAGLIADSWTGTPLNKSDLFKAGVLHDIAKPMKFDLGKQAEFGMSPDDIQKLAQLQEELNTKYGDDEHHATVGICREIGISKNAVKLVDNLEWDYVPKLLSENEFESLVLIYADMRIGPKGILSLAQRHEDLQKRENNENLEERIRNSQNLEQLIAQNVSINLNRITDQEINSSFKELLNIEL